MEVHRCSAKLARVYPPLPRQALIERGCLVAPWGAAQVISRDGRDGCLMRRGTRRRYVPAMKKIIAAAGTAAAITAAVIATTATGAGAPTTLTCTTAETHDASLDT